ncbi:hypothetical protein M569_03227 [Genlisea aurea]|uniref:Uncharacterized protein n=1 Tax=Genlisea aurea TaxID=192259 RepID=S8E6Q6_9LAMI|nr:hypothetical protein M569_03227 [Genlisea aurea]
MGMTDVNIASAFSEFGLSANQSLIGTSIEALQVLVSWPTNTTSRNTKSKNSDKTVAEYSLASLLIHGWLWWMLTMAQMIMAAGVEEPLLPAGRLDNGKPSFIPGAVFNVSTSIIGAGIMSIPATFKVLGVIPAFVMLLLTLTL